MVTWCQSSQSHGELWRAWVRWLQISWNSVVNLRVAHSSMPLWWSNKKGCYYAISWYLVGFEIRNAKYPRSAVWVRSISFPVSPHGAHSGVPLTSTKWTITHPLGVTSCTWGPAPRWPTPQTGHLGLTQVSPWNDVKAIRMYRGQTGVDVQGADRGLIECTLYLGTKRVWAFQERKTQNFDLLLTDLKDFLIIWKYTHFWYYCFAVKQSSSR